MSEHTETLAVHHRLTVAAPPERAFAVFTERVGAWWPLDGYSIGAAPAVTAVMEPRAGGRWFERAADGGEADWGRVLAWEPPHRVLLAWEVSADWRHDPGAASEVEVRFRGDGEGGTVVELEHRGLEIYGERAAEMRDVYGSPDGWAGLLARFATVTEDRAVTEAGR